VLRNRPFYWRDRKGLRLSSLKERENLGGKLRKERSRRKTSKRNKPEMFEKSTRRCSQGETNDRHFCRERKFRDLAIKIPEDRSLSTRGGDKKKHASLTRDPIKGGLYSVCSQGEKGKGGTSFGPIEERGRAKVRGRADAAGITIYY